MPPSRDSYDKPPKFGTTRMPSPEPSELVQQIARLENEHERLSTELGQIQATLEINFGASGRSVGGIKVDSSNYNSTHLFLVEVLKRLVAGKSLGIHNTGT